MGFFKKKQKAEPIKVDFLQAVRVYENDLTQKYISARAEKDTDKKIALLSDCLVAAAVLEKYCADNGKEEYFDKTWHHCHNSKCADFSYIQRIQDEFDNLRKKRGMP